MSENQNFQNVIEQSKDNSLITSASQLIEEVNENYIRDLTKRAERALQEGLILTADTHNSITYLNRALAINKKDSSAIAIQNEIVKQLIFDAAAAEDKVKYGEAQTYYETILLMLPGDTYVKKQIHKLDSLIREKRFKPKKINKFSANPASLSKDKNIPDTKDGAEGSSVNETALTKIKENHNEAVFLSGDATKRVTKKPDSIKSSDISVTDSLLTADRKNLHRKSEKNLQPPLNSSSETATSLIDPSINSKQNVSLIEVQKTDQGRKHYLVKATPNIPENWGHKGITSVHTRCIVGITGLVESVKIVSIDAANISPDELKTLITITSETLNRYKYKPATLSGNPIKFIVSEEISF